MHSVALRNPQEERAAQHLAAGFALTPEERAKRGLPMTASLQEEAASLGGLDTGASSFRANARKFCQRKVIRERVAGIQYQGAMLASTSVASLLVEAEEARDLAMKLKEPSAANQCIQTKAKLAGVWRDKVEATGKDGVPLAGAAVSVAGPTIIMTGNPGA
ncbi:hypothetical protein [Bradyrhizobium betae]|uniref:Uncharacterized protein n=1 Tax=Bradyrhizobium betae TaxID=244734 RepID=A0A5P6NZK4_9BRAD|nr:hypothetical protein [Bradyrhizobium betae]MCS3725486.1 hypothetical protein [Bradyrhizobium betae]QFI71224.1 hypothetical protein F8237_01840 [Bradyrhizobium betae]